MVRFQNLAKLDYTCPYSIIIQILLRKLINMLQTKVPFEPCARDICLILYPMFIGFRIKSESIVKENQLANKQELSYKNLEVQMQQGFGGT